MHRPGWEMRRDRHSSGVVHRPRRRRAALVPERRAHRRRAIEGARPLHRPIRRRLPIALTAGLAPARRRASASFSRAIFSSCFPVDRRAARPLGLRGGRLLAERRALGAGDPRQLVDEDGVRVVDLLRAALGAWCPCRRRPASVRGSAPASCSPSRATTTTPAPRRADRACRPAAAAAAPPRAASA